MAGKEHLREFKERAIAARAANATKEGWDSFMRIFDGEKIAAAKAEMLERIEKSEPSSNIPDDLILEGYTPAENDG